jgi:hypothetical protein
MIDEMRQMVLMMLFLLGMIWVANALFVWTVKRRKRNRRVSVTPPRYGFRDNHGPTNVRKFINPRQQ